MSLAWFRVHHDMITDPKFRVIARLSGKPLPCVVAVFVYCMTEASQAAERGSLAGLRHEDAAAALDMDETDVSAIVDAMQGRLIVSDRLTGWERRQPKREDDSADRVRQHRQAKKGNAVKRDVTHGNAPEKDTDTDTDIPEADASGAAAPEPVKPIDLKAAVFEAGVSLLAPGTGDVRKAKSMIGRWRSEYSDAAVLDALAVAQAEQPSEPIPFITRVLGTRNGKRPRNERPSGWAPRPGMEGVEPAYLTD